MRRLPLLILWTLREPSHWRVALLIFLVLVFALLSGVVRVGGSSLEPPEQAVANVLSFTATHVVLVAYPFLFPLVSVLVTLVIVVQRQAGGLAALQALGYRRWEIISAHSFAVFVLASVPALAAFLVLPPLIEPAMAAVGRMLPLYPAEYWTSMPRLILAILFMSLFAVAFALFIRRAAVAFGAMITFFFVGWYLESQVGVYGLFTPPGAFLAAYGVFRPLAGIPLDPNLTFMLYLAAGTLAYLGALVYANGRGEL